MPEDNVAERKWRNEVLKMLGRQNDVLHDISGALERIETKLTAPPPPAADNTSPDDLLTPAEAAEMLRITTATLRNWRAKWGYGRGPRIVKAGKAIRYRRGDLTDWIRKSDEKRPMTDRNYTYRTPVPQQTAPRGQCAGSGTEPKRLSDYGADRGICAFCRDEAVLLRKDGLLRAHRVW